MSRLLGVLDVHDYVKSDMVLTTNTVNEERVENVGGG